MKIKTMLFTVVAALLVVPAFATAQIDCWDCDDSDWTDPECVEQGWSGFGQEECDDVGTGTGCDMGGDACVGPPHLAATHILPMGTILAAGSEASEDMTGQMAQLRLITNCHDLVVGRIYSTRAANAIRASSTVLEL